MKTLRASRTEWEEAMTDEHQIATDTANIGERLSPHHFNNGKGPSWSEYASTLKALDEIWRERRLGNTAFGVFGPQPGWEDTIQRGQMIFAAESWVELSDDQIALIAPAHSFADGDALLGSIGRRSNDVRAFLSAAESADDRDKVLSLLKEARTIGASTIPLMGGEILTEMCSARGMGRSFALDYSRSLDPMAS
jgi:hypothetical protein